MRQKARPIIGGTLLHEFDKLFAVSDLHLGGFAPRQVFRETEALVWLINQVIGDPATCVGLLLNGDIFDFLADEPNAEEFTLTPERMIRQVASDTNFVKIFQALRALVALPNRYLIIQLGNHDIEMALPSAQNEILQQLGLPIGSNKVIFETAGYGWTCKVGSRLVMALHGNASDPWNEVDHDSLQRTVEAISKNQPMIPYPTTNAGTALVIHVMNKIKKEYPFVDLLKPETAPLMAVLEAVNSKKSIEGLIYATGKRLLKGQINELLSAESEFKEEFTGPKAEIADFISNIDLPPSESIEPLLRAEKHLAEKKTPKSLISDEKEKLKEIGNILQVKLQRAVAALSRLRGTPNLTSLRKALSKWLQKDETFDTRQWSDIDRKIFLSASPGAEIVLAGHTHLPRQIYRGSTLYINTGTWMRVLKLQGSLYLNSDSEFQKFFIAIQSNSMDALDSLNIDPRSRPVAVIDNLSARLCFIQGNQYQFNLLPVVG